MSNGVLYVGDNLEVLRLFFSDLVDLIYLDPPFNTGRKFISADGAKSGSFNDVWNWSMIPQDWSDQLRSDWPDLYQLVDLSGRTHSQAMSSFLCFMAVRLIELHRVLKPTGSIFLHCDPTASHYLKAIMDRIFGSSNFRNELIWPRIRGGGKILSPKSKSWGRSTDSILFYSKSSDLYINPYRELRDQDEILVRFPKIDENGERYNLGTSLFCRPTHKSAPHRCFTWKGHTSPHPSGWMLSKERLEEEFDKGNIVIRPDGKLERRKYLRDYKGVAVNNLWDDILPASGKEKTGYPTQKPLALLDRILRAACPEGGIVLDPFAGSGTTLVAAERLGYKWIGIDQNEITSELIKARLPEGAGKFQVIVL